MQAYSLCISSMDRTQKIKHFLNVFISGIFGSVQEKIQFVQENG